MRTIYGSTELSIYGNRLRRTTDHGPCQAPAKTPPLRIPRRESWDLKRVGASTRHARCGRDGGLEAEFTRRPHRLRSVVTAGFAIGIGKQRNSMAQQGLQLPLATLHLFAP